MDLVDKTINAGADVLLNVIPAKIGESGVLKEALQKWYEEEQCQVEIGQHGYTHIGEEYDMPSLGFAGQQKIVQAGKDELAGIGIAPRSFTPPGGAQDEVTMKVLMSMGFETNINWWAKVENAHGVTLIDTLRLCNMDIGAQSGADCVFKTPEKMLSEARAQAKR